MKVKETIKRKRDVKKIKETVKKKRDVNVNKKGR